MRTVIGMGIYYQALRRYDSGSPEIVQCRGDEDRPEDVREAYAEQRAVDDYVASLPKRVNKRQTKAENKNQNRKAKT
jgi:hypothetical protein